MRRRDVPVALLTTAAGTGLISQRAQAQTCTSPCYPQTPEEALGSITPSATEYAPSPIVDVRRYGFSESGTETSNTLAIEAAISALAQGSTTGGIVQLPAGQFACGPFDVPQFVTIQGAGGRATRLTCSVSGYLIRVGGAKSGVLKYKCGVSDVWIENTHPDGHAIRLMETCGANIARVYAEGTLQSGRSNIGITIDGGDASSFFNHVHDVIMNHYQTGYQLQSSGTTHTTLNHFTNCTIVGDVGSVGSASVGFRLVNGQGSGSVWIGGNLESCGRGVRLESGCNSMTFHGARFEGNTKDIEIEATAGASSFFGCFLDTSNGILNNASSGYDMHSFFGCLNGSNQHTGSVFSVAYRSGTSTPVGVVTPRFIGEEYLRTSGTVTWFKSTGLTNTAWVALN